MRPALRVLLLGCLTLAAAAWLRAEDRFSQALSPEEFQAAGLGKLTPEELKKLDALVHAQQTGQLARVREEARAQARQEVKQEVTQQVKAEVKQEVRQEVTQEVKAQMKAEVTQQVRQEVKAEVKAEVQAEVRAEAAAKPAAPAGPGFLDRMKVMLLPGTTIEYTTLDATIPPPFHGWSTGTVITLTNGQRWVVTDDGRYWSPTVNHPVAAKIVPGSLGSFFMEIDHGGRPRVKFAGNVPVTPPPSAPAGR
jgi:hypothetical protein